MAALSFERGPRSRRDAGECGSTFTLTGPMPQRPEYLWLIPIYLCRDLVAHRRFMESCCGAIVVVQRASQALAPLDHACVSQMPRLRADESVRQALVIALGMIMRDEVLNGGPQRVLSK